MTNKFYNWKILSLILIGFFPLQVKAMEVVENESISTRLNPPLTLDVDEEVQNIFTKATSSLINQREANDFMKKASFSLIGALLRLGNESSLLLKKKILEFHSLYRSRCFEIIQYLCTNHISIMEEEKEEFLLKLAGQYGDVVFYYCKKGEPYLTFLQENKATLQNGVGGYITLHNATDFWTAWVEYIESNPSSEDWEKARHYNECSYRRHNYLIDPEEYKKRAESYLYHRKYSSEKKEGKSK
jgi:hypothetical protein